MGLKTTASNVNDEASRRNSHIDRLLKAEKGAARKTTTVLLLGAADHLGKSTIVKQMRMIPSDGFSEQEQQGVLRAQSPREGATEVIFTQAGINWRMVDLCGQTLERKKWMPCLGDVDCLVFVVALSSYDHCLAEGHCTNQMREAMKLFDSSANSDHFKSKPILLILDKLDVFEEKLNHSPISGHFPDFHDSAATFWAAAEYFGHLFQQINRTQGREICVHYTNTTDDNFLKSMMALLYQIVMAQRLRSHGVLDIH
ncbi:unnamed protein product [Penicillium salamii]|uniref:Uncharacterized protein n=1 Tax=Penicillium salamii TaxID=1612424 RepID=A0A9W4NWM0_9EURO|nr:unnamed protein product [Penicillium salamii]CAG8222910.1 unnamed protein product [Penicillium salamii]CAG8285037.1 unnamed protein product [Penicillium salamii]CAG8392735.1 unnamed protein product [Penicillium salamii]CAG8418056.1 unnamed protein product [Penicillium salamii]